MYFERFFLFADDRRRDEPEPGSARVKAAILLAVLAGVIALMVATGGAAPSCGDGAAASCAGDSGGG